VAGIQATGFIENPYGCPGCGWSEDSDYDLSTGKDPVDDRGGAIDQYGSYHRRVPLWHSPTGWPARLSGRPDRLADRAPS